MKDDVFRHINREMQNFIIIWYYDKCVHSILRKSGKAFWKDVRDDLYLEGRYPVSFVNNLRGHSVQRKSCAKHRGVRQWILWYVKSQCELLKNIFSGGQK